MKVRSLIKDKTINEWFDVINAPESTRRSYMQGIKEYTILCNKTPSDLLKEAKTEVGKGIPRSETKLRGYLLKYRNSLQNR
ncbi:MAG: hypothetical protein QG646_1156 [Euryarchaeota archaeon]|nr:hypothetical protein [Euryarchaeota archaeon]